MSSALARSLVFATSAAVLIIEILAVRLLAPYLGISLEVFTAVIGVVLAGISVGAWTGGRWADRTDPHRLPGPLLVLGGITALASPLLIDVVGPGLGTGPLFPVVATLIAFFAPAALLSAVPPVVVKIRLASLAETGTVVGSFSAVGTAGAIFGTFLTGFVLIAAFPTRPIVIVLGALLSITGLALWIKPTPRQTTNTLIAMVTLAAALLLIDGPCQFETAYHCVVIQADPDRQTGRTLILDRLPNSYVDLADPGHLEFRYIRLIADVMGLAASDGPIDMVSIGGGGFTLPRYVEATRPGSDNIVLEIDPSLIAIARDHLDLSADVSVVSADARVSLREIADAGADIVIGDAYSGASVPWHLTTVEYVGQIARVLRPDGVYAMNVIDYGNLAFVKSATATIASVFDHAAVLAPPRYFSGIRGGNFVILGSDSPLDLDELRRRIVGRGGSEIFLEMEGLADWIAGADLLRDDHAPVDQMLGRP